MTEQTRFWFVQANINGKDVDLAVAAFTERSARMQARKQLGVSAKINIVNAVNYAHAWIVDFAWRGLAAPEQEPPRSAGGPFRDRPFRFDCPECGPGIGVDEDGCCRTCGADAQPAAAAALPVLEPTNLRMSANNIARGLRRIARGTRLSSLDVPILEDAADALERAAAAAPEQEKL